MRLPIFPLLFVAASVVTSMATDPRDKKVNDEQKPLTPSSQSSDAPALIDSLRRHYLALENDLWHLIESGIDTAYVLEQTQIVYRTFFSEPFREFNVTFNDYAADRQTQLLSAVDDIRRTVAMAMKNCLHQNPLAFDEAATIGAARRQLNLTHQIDTLFAITGSTDFYETIQNVSDCDC